MDENTCILYLSIAKAGIDAGKEISLERKNYTQNGNILSGAFSKSDIKDAGIILRVFDPVPVDESVDIEEE